MIRCFLQKERGNPPKTSANRTIAWLMRARVSSMARPPDVKEIEKDIEMIRAQKEAAIKAQDYEKAAALRDSEKQTQDKLERILSERCEEREIIVTGDDIMHIASKRTRVPLNRMEQKEAQKLQSSFCPRASTGARHFKADLEMFLLLVWFSCSPCFV
jgi:hypothetical protein